MVKTRSSNKSEIIAAIAKNHLCYKLTYDSIIDKLKSQPDIFGHTNKYLVSKQGYAVNMKNEMFRICCDLLLDEYEIVYWLTIIESPDFDVITVR